MRLLDLPGIRDLENLHLLNDYAHVGIAEQDKLSNRIDDLSIKYFGIAESDTYYAFPDDFEELKRSKPEEAYRLQDERDEFDARFFCAPNRPFGELLSYLDSRGWDLTNDNGGPLRLLERFARQIEAATRGLVEGACLPSVEAVKAEKWEANLAEAAKQHMKRKARG